MSMYLANFLQKASNYFIENFGKNLRRLILKGKFIRYKKRATI